MAIIIENKTPASVVRKSMENRAQLQNKGDIYIGTGGKIEAGSTIPDTKGQNIIDAINDNSENKEIKAGSFTAASFKGELKGNADTATNAINADTATNAINADTATNARHADNATNARNADNATNATYAQYASEDTSKGTIEERLTNLGFKSGSATIASGSASPNNLYRQGNYVYGRIGITGATRALNTTWFTLPQNFRPKTAFTTSARGQLKGMVYTDTVTKETWLTLKFNTDGTVIVTEADTSLVEHLIGITKLNVIQFGFEAPAIT